MKERQQIKMKSIRKLIRTIVKQEGLQLKSIIFKKLPNDLCGRFKQSCKGFVLCSFLVCSWDVEKKGSILLSKDILEDEFFSNYQCFIFELICHEIAHIKYHHIIEGKVHNKRFQKYYQTLIGKYFSTFIEYNKQYLLEGDVLTAVNTSKN